MTTRAWPGDGTEVVVRSVALVAEFLVWWHQAGNRYYGKPAGDGGMAPSGATFQLDEGLRSFAVEAVSILGGWRGARCALRGAPPRHEARTDARAIRLRA